MVTNDNLGSYLYHARADLDRLFTNINRAIATYEAKNAAPPLRVIQFISQSDAKESMRACIRKRKDGRWEWRYTQNGRQHSLYARTKEELKEKIKKNVKREDKTENKSLTLSEWFETYVKTYKEGRVKPAYIGSLRTAAKHFGALNGMRLSQITGLDIQKILNAIPGTRTLETVSGLIKALFAKALALGMVKRDPCTAIEVTPHHRQTREAIPTHELEKLLAVMRGTKREAVFLFLLNTGLRPSELLRVRGTDIDPETSMLRVRGTKTENAIRSVPVPKSYAELYAGNPDVLFVHAMKRLNEELAKLCEIAGIAKYTLYNFRHTYATRLYEAGVPDILIKTWMGHSNINFTKSHYIHALDDFVKANAKTLDGLYFV